MTARPTLPAAPLPRPGRPGLPSPCPPIWRSQDLLKDQPEVHIVHGAEVYRLRRTALGKLILTK